MGDDEHLLAAVLPADGVEDAPHPQPHVAPALAARRPVVELADPGPGLGLVGEALRDAGVGEPVEDPELPLPQPLVDRRSRRRCPPPRRRARRCAGPARTATRARPSGARPARPATTPGPEPAARPARTARRPCRAPRCRSPRTGALGRVPGDVPGALAVADDQKQLGPAGVVGHGPTSTPTSPRAHGGSSTSWSCRAQPPRCLACRMRAPSASSCGVGGRVGERREQVLLLVLHVVGDEPAQHRDGLRRAAGPQGPQVVDLLLDRRVRGQRPVEARRRRRAGRARSG